MGSDHSKPPTISADEALQRLIAGNERFRQGQAHFPTIYRETLADLARGQQPYATILGCSDSRVPPELIFDANFGGLFILRVAGNVVSPEVMGSLQYAGQHLHTPLFLVLGHEGCGAVKAASIARFTTCSTVHGYKSSLTTSCLVCGTSTQVQQMRIVLHKLSKLTFGGRCGSYRGLSGRVSCPRRRPRQAGGSCLRDCLRSRAISGRFGYLARTALLPGHFFSSSSPLVRDLGSEAMLRPGFCSDNQGNP